MSSENTHTIETAVSRQILIDAYDSALRMAGLLNADEYLTDIQFAGAGLESKAGEKSGTFDFSNIVKFKDVVPFRFTFSKEDKSSRPGSDKLVNAKMA